MLWVSPPIIIQSTSISHAKRQIFNRAHNFISTPRLFTIRNTSNSQSKTHLRTSFLQNSSQWLLSQISVIFLERQKQKQFSVPSLCLIQLTGKLLIQSLEWLIQILSNWTYSEDLCDVNFAHVRIKQKPRVNLSKKKKTAFTFLVLINS